MIKQNYNVIGVMSGTSLDGVDLAQINFSVVNGKYSYTIQETATVPYSNEWSERLKVAVDFNKEELHKLNKDYTVLLAGIIKEFIRQYNITGIDAVCSHGHTILHQPQKKLTLQIGNLPRISRLCGQRVACNFRVQDVQMGGQGAPLVPIGDELLFAEYDYCVNLGGFSNISFNEKGKRLAYDICAVNTVLNYYANKLGFAYDDKGSIAAAGNVNQDLFKELNALPYYKLPYPKSLGFEYVNATLIPLIEKHDLSAEDKLATYTEHIAIQLAAAIDKEQSRDMLVLVTGGGAYNTHLITRLKELLPGFTIIIPDDKTIQYKEALIFAFLGVLKLREEINVLGSVTGAPGDHCAGYIYEPI